jgi:hypothetical protein
MRRRAALKKGAADLEAAREALKSGEFIPWEKVKADLGL